MSAGKPCSPRLAERRRMPLPCWSSDEQPRYGATQVREALMAAEDVTISDDEVRALLGLPQLKAGPA